MGFSVAQKIPSDHANSVQPSKNQGTLKTESKEQTVTLSSDTATVAKVIKAVSEFFQEMNQKSLAEGGDLDGFLISPEQLEMQEEITKMLTELALQEGIPELADADADLQLMLPSPFAKEKESKDLHPNNRSSKPSAESAKQNGPNQTTQSSGRSEVVYSSLFTLARSFNKAVAEGRIEKQNMEKRENHDLKDVRPQQMAGLNKEAPIQESANTHQQEREREGDGKHKDQEQNQNKDEQEGQADKEAQQDYDKKRKSKHKKESAFLIEKVQVRGSVHESSGSKPEMGKQLSASRSQSSARKRTPQASKTSPSSSGSRAQKALGGIENIYIRFMALMARILGQAEAEAHQLYLRIKDRTDAIDVLTLLMSKINSEKGAIDWSKNEEMKQLIEKARAIGVDIPEGKYKWTEDEKKMLKENIQMRKDSMEKVTQLERTDMQRFLQEASQCHQARSNILKLLKEVTDNIIGNMRP